MIGLTLDNPGSNTADRPRAARTHHVDRLNILNIRRAKHGYRLNIVNIRAADPSR